MPLDMTQFHQVFFDETAEHLATMESLLLYLDASHPDPEQLDDLSRAAHSIKGSGGTFGFEDMAGLAQEIEALIARVQRGGERLTAQCVQAMHEACGVLRSLLAAHRGEGEVAHDTVAHAVDLLRGRPRDPGGKVSPHGTAKAFAEVAGTRSDLARRTAKATHQVMDLVEAAGSGNLGDVTEAVRVLGEAIEQNALLAEQAAGNADSLRESFRVLVLTVAGLALSPQGTRAASARPTRAHPLPKVRRATGGAGNDNEWPEF